jgi:hypothetical protein
MWRETFLGDGTSVRKNLNVMILVYGRRGRLNNMYEEQRFYETLLRKESMKLHVGIG